MADRWKLGKYEFMINPNRYGEQIEMVGDNIKTLDGTLIVQPTSTQETYSFSSTFFQHRPRIKSEVSSGGGNGIEFLNNKFYILDAKNMKVNVFNKNMSTIEKSIQIITTPNEENIIDFDVQSDETVWAVERLSSQDYIHKIVGTTRTKTAVPSLMGDIVGIKRMGDNLWVATNMARLYALNPSNLSIVQYVDLPNISFASYGYRGMTAMNGYIIVSYSDSEVSGVIYIDSSNGNLCNNFYLPKRVEIKDITFDGNSFIFLVSDGSLIYSTGNTVMLDLYNLEKEIKSYGFINMIDDMGVKKRVFVSDYSIDRQEGNLYKYLVSITATKVGRGLN